MIGTAAVACGKKGPPLAPLVPIPAAIAQIEARRLGNDVFVTFAIPAVNVDEHLPADVDRIDVYAYTGRSAPPRARWVEFATLVATVPVTPPPPEPGTRERPRPGPPPPPGAPEQGEQVTVLDTLTPDELVQGREPIRDPRSVIRDPDSAVRDARAAIGAAASAIGDLESAGGDPRTLARRAADLPLKRFYIAVPFNRRGRPGPPGGVAEFPLFPAPEPPASVAIQYTDRTIRLAWEPSGGLIGFLLERTLPEEPLPFLSAEEEEESPEPEAAPQPAGPVSYLVYREELPGPSTPPGPRDAPWRAAVPAPITGVPVQTLTFRDSLEYEHRRCYTVRAVRGLGPAAHVGAASTEACVTPIDTFAPAPPLSVVTVPAEGAISLVWEPNTELDLGGYIVLRGEAPGDTLLPLTPAPVLQARYRDEAVTPGTRYVYAVVAVDNRFPVPNMSPASGTVEETAR